MAYGDPNLDSDGPVAAPAPAPAQQTVTDDNWGDSDAVAPSGPDYLKTLPPSRAQLVQAIGEGRMPAPHIQGRGGAISPDAAALLADVAQAYPKYDAVDAPRRIAAGKAWTSGKLGQQAITIGTALEHAMTLEQSIKQLGNVQSPIPLTTSLVNGVRNTAASLNGEDPIIAYRANAEPVLEEMSKAFHGGSSEGSVSRLGFTLPENGSMSQQRTAVQTYVKLLKGKLDELQSGYNKAIGTTSKGLPMISEEANKNLSAFLDPNYIHNGVASQDQPNAPSGAPIIGGPPSGGSPPPPGTPPTGGAPDATTRDPNVFRYGDAQTAPTRTLSEDGGAEQITAKDQQFANEAQGILNRPHTTEADFTALEQKYGFAPGHIPRDQLSAAITWRNQHGKGASIQPTPSVVNAPSPTSGVGAVADGILNNGRAAVVGAGDSATLGLLPKIIGAGNAVEDKFNGDQRSFGEVYGNDLADAHSRMDALSNAHPVATLAGQAAGFIGADGLVGAAPGVGKLASKIPGLFRPAVGDALVGGLYGAGSQDNLADVPGGVLKGATFSAAGGVLGRGTAKAVGSALSPIANESVQRLTKAGVTLTPGQILGAGGGVLGRTIKGLEDKATSISLVGDAINATRRGGVEDLNRATINDALAPIGASLPHGVPVGHVAIEHAQQTISQAYDNALLGMSAVPDAAFNADLQVVAKSTKTLSQPYREQFANYVDTHVQPYIAGKTSLDGSDLQAIKQGLDKKIANLRGQGSTPQDRELADTFEGVQSAVLDMAARTSPQKSAEFDAANKAYSLFSRVQNAASKAKDGVFTPNQFRQAVIKRGYGTTTANVARGAAPMQQLATDASTILPSAVPDSGTAGRAALALGGRLALGGALGGSEEGVRTGSLAGAALGATAGALAFSRPGAKAIQWGLAGSRGKTANTLGALVRRNAALGGAVGSPLLLDTVANRGN